MQWSGHQEAVCLPILPWTDQSWVRFPLILAILMFAEMSFGVRKMIVIAILFRVKIGSKYTEWWQNPIDKIST